jgi:hypothetical protein
MNMNKAVIAVLGIAIILFSVNRCSSDTEGEPLSFIEPSKVDSGMKAKREEVFSKWLSASEHRKRFKNKYYKKTYPAYVEMDSLGNRRVLEIDRKPGFSWYVSTGHLLEEFPKLHIQQTMNHGKHLLSLHIIKKDGFKVFSAVWVSNSVFSREAKRLQAYGIYPPEFTD